MKIFSYLVITSICLVFSGSLLASPERDIYFSTQLSLATYDEVGTSDANPALAIIRFGGYKNRNFAIELRLGAGIQDDSTGGSSLKINGLYGVYGVGLLNISESSAIYGLIGGTSSKGIRSGPGGSVTVYEDGFSAGLGANFGLGTNMALNIEYMSYFNRANISFSTVGVGLVFNY